MVCPRFRMGEGFVSNRYPSPILARGSTELPSPARGEGNNSGDRAVGPAALVVVSHDVKQPISFPRRIFASGVCNFASLTPNEGWAERRETFGCCAKHPWGVS